MHRKYLFYVIPFVFISQKRRAHKQGQIEKKKENENLDGIKNNSDNRFIQKKKKKKEKGAHRIVSL